MRPNPEEWFRKMREAAGNPSTEPQPPVPKPQRRRETSDRKLAREPKLDYLRNWEKKKEEDDERRTGQSI